MAIIGGKYVHYRKALGAFKPEEKAPAPPASTSASASTPAPVLDPTPLLQQLEKNLEAKLGSIVKGALGDFAGKLSEMIEAKVEAAVERALQKDQGEYRMYRAEGMLKPNTKCTSTDTIIAPVPIHDVDDAGLEENDDFAFSTDPDLNEVEAAEDPQTAHDLASEDDLYGESESEHPGPPPSMSMDELDREDQEVDVEVEEPERDEPEMGEYLLLLKIIVNKYSLT